MQGSQLEKSGGRRRGAPIALATCPRSSIALALLLTAPHLQRQGRSAQLAAVSWCGPELLRLPLQHPAGVPTAPSSARRSAPRVWLTAAHPLPPGACRSVAGSGLCRRPLPAAAMPAFYSLWIVGRNGGLLYSRVSGTIRGTVSCAAAAWLPLLWPDCRHYLLWLDCRQLDADALLRLFHRTLCRCRPSSSTTSCAWPAAGEERSPFRQAACL